MLDVPIVNQSQNKLKNYDIVKYSIKKRYS